MKGSTRELGPGHVAGERLVSGRDVWARGEALWARASRSSAYEYYSGGTAGVRDCVITQVGNACGQDTLQVHEHRQA